VVTVFYLPSYHARLRSIRREIRWRWRWRHGRSRNYTLLLVCRLFFFFFFFFFVSQSFPEGVVRWSFANDVGPGGKPLLPPSGK